MRDDCIYMGTAERENGGRERDLKLSEFWVWEFEREVLRLEKSLCQIW